MDLLLVYLLVCVLCPLGHDWGVGHVPPGDHINRRKVVSVKGQRLKGHPVVGLLVPSSVRFVGSRR